ncbi:hypothetical protein ACPJHQ_13820 [Rossellomorea sp. H39__3]
MTPKEGFLNRTIVSDDVYLVPKADGTLTIGATEQVGSFSEDVAAESVSRLLAKACTIAPGIAAAAWEKHGQARGRKHPHGSHSWEGFRMWRDCHWRQVTTGMGFFWLRLLEC